MKNQLFAVHYINRHSEEPDVSFLVSTGEKVREEVEKAIEDGRIQTLQKNPTVLGYSYISGYTIEPVADSLENIYESLRRNRDRLAEEGGQKDLNSYFGYLEGIRDFLNACRKDWREEDEKERVPEGNKEIVVNVEEDEVAYAEFNEGDSVRINFFSGGSNIPHGYNDEGERI
ncbi:MAG TPA: hypothetical protein PLA45_02375 [Candidatus Dojkabacteria bacterium]|nr:hypothetical protein [Candidatus Dojkabacteria bacterium]